jgi:adenine-specific DNA-methyltransferase
VNVPRLRKPASGRTGGRPVPSFRFPDEGWARLAKNLKAEIDPELIKALGETVSLPFGPGKYSPIAVKIVDDRGIESLEVAEVV